MKDEHKIKEQLINELVELRQRVAELEAADPERQRVEKALRESGRFLHSVLDAIQDGISVLDCDLNVIRVNSWMEKMYAAKMPLIGKKMLRGLPRKAVSVSLVSVYPNHRDGRGS